jgi:hypothetical protein
MPNIPQINLPGANVPGGAPPPPQAPHLAPTSFGAPVLQGLAVNNPPIPPNIPPPGGIPPAGVAPIGVPAVPPLVAQAPLQFPPPPAAPAAPAPLPVPHAGHRGEITDPPVLTNVPIGLPETLLGIPPPQFQGMSNFAPSSFCCLRKLTSRSSVRTRRFPHRTRALCTRCWTTTRTSRHSRGQ